MNTAQSVVEDYREGLITRSQALTELVLQLAETQEAMAAIVIDDVVGDDPPIDFDGAMTN